MKKILNLLVIAILALMVSCNGSTDKKACLSSVKKMFPSSEIYAPFTGSDVQFMVVDTSSNNIYMVKTKSLTSPKVTEVIYLTRVD